MGEVSKEASASSEGNLVTSEPAMGTKVPAAWPNTKRAQLIGLLERPEGASVGEIGERLGWLPHGAGGPDGVAACRLRSQSRQGCRGSVHLSANPGAGTRPMTPLMAPRLQADQADRPPICSATSWSTATVSSSSMWRSARSCAAPTSPASCG